MTLLAGKSACELHYGKVAIGCGDDLSKAAAQICRRVETLGSNGILGVNVSGRYDGSDIGKMERETILRAELERYLFKTKELLAANRDLVQELADALLKKQTLLHSDIQSICGRYRAVPAA